MKILVASTNPVKINCVTQALDALFPHEKHEVKGISVPSGVNDQPKGNDEIFEGAMNRAKNAATTPDATGFDICVGIEGGIEDTPLGMEVFAWIIAIGRDGRVGKGRTGTFFLPQKIAELIHQGKELGEADDIVFGIKNSKQKNGAVGILTGDAISRTEFYKQAAIFALIPFKNKELY